MWRAQNDIAGWPMLDVEFDEIILKVSVGGASTAVGLSESNESYQLTTIPVFRGSGAVVVPSSL